MLAMTTKTSIAPRRSPVLDVACAMVVAPATTSSRFFGLTAPSPTARPKALTAVKESIADIQPGVGGVAPSRGRPDHCLTASSRRSRPSTSLTTLAHVAGPASASSEVPLPTSSTTTPPRTAIPSIQPTRKANPLLRARRLTSMRTTATIGIGLTSTPTAIGSDAPMAGPMTPPLTWSHDRRGRRRAVPPPCRMSSWRGACAQTSPCSVAACTAARRPATPSLR